MPLDRQSLFDDTSLTGRAWCRAHSDLIDTWLAKLVQDAVGSVAAHGIALVAVGGYGRAELAPCSDIDVVLLHRGRDDIATVADRVWYPVWDEGLKLGHSVRTVKEAVRLAEDDLDTATSLLTIRHLAGDPSLTAELADAAANQWQRRAKKWLTDLARSVDERHRRAGEVAFHLEPDLKEGRGGLRDVHALHWAEAARRILFGGDDHSLGQAYGVLLDARVELQRRTNRPSNQLVLQEQDAVAAALADPDADALMARIAAAGRAIAWVSDDSWRRVASSLRGPLGRLARRDRPVAPGLILRDDEVHLTPDADPATDPGLVLRAAAHAAAAGSPINRDTLVRLDAAPPLPEPWADEARHDLVALLRAGRAAVGVIEALDQVGLWVRVLPEWQAVQSKPQRNAYHRFTVDRHLLEAAANCAALADRVSRPDLLVVGTLLHDIGKGHAGDHTEVGIELVERIGPRLGFAPDDVAELVAMVRHHLLLPDVAVRRDLDDPTTIDQVADIVGSQRTLELLAALTEADSIATGPSAWGTWKAELVAELVARVAHVLAGGEAHDVVDDEFPTAHQRALLEARNEVLEGDDDVLSVITVDRPGLFSRVAGVLALHGLDVLGASAYSTDDGMALSQFRVESSFGPVIAWERVCDDLRQAFSGRLALQARLEERARRYATRVPIAAVPAITKVTFDNDASAAATVVDVQAPDAVGLLYRITRALADLDLDIRSAKVQTVGPQVLDAFYVCRPDGTKITDEEHLGEIERALLDAVAR